MYLILSYIVNKSYNSINVRNQFIPTPMTSITVKTVSPKFFCARPGLQWKKIAI